MYVPVEASRQERSSVAVQSGVAIERRYPDGWFGGEVSVVPTGPDEDDAVLMEHGIQFVHPANYRLLVIR